MRGSELPPRDSKARFSSHAFTICMRARLAPEHESHGGSACGRGGAQTFRPFLCLMTFEYSCEQLLACAHS